MRDDSASRRKFLGGATIAAVATRLASSRRAQAAPASTDPIRVGLIGCGGRGTGAATNALRADPGVRLVAMGDAFPDRVETSLAALKKTEGIAERVDVPAERQFVGFDAYQKVLDAGVDVVVLATPPHFRPLHFKAAVDAGKHAFVEKPVAVDGPGVRSVLATCEEAKRKNLSVVSGLCWRYDAAARETIKRIHTGAIGELRHVFVNDFRGPIWVKARKPEWNDMEYQMRNWYYFTWLSGDFNVEQHVHLLDLVSWIVKGEYPTRAYGVGGRTWRSANEYGNIYDHHAVTYEYASGLKIVSHCRQYSGCHNETSVHVLGAKGTATWAEKRTKINIGKKTWEPSVQNDKFQAEHDELFASIRKGKPLNNGEYMAKSTLMGVMGRAATYTGQVITWDEIMASTEDLSPTKYAWGPLPSPPAAIPGRRDKA